MDLKDEFYMRMALKQAEQAGIKGEVPVGAVVVSGDRVLSLAHNLRETDYSPVAHAEILAIEQASKQLKSWRLNDCTIYITLEPCPMCAGAIINSRISRVVYGAADEKAGAAGSVINIFDMPFNHRPAIRPGVLQEECSRLISEFFTKIREDEKPSESLQAGDNGYQGR